MNAPEQIVCKPTPWFTLRAGAMLAMFGVFSVLFYIDGTTGYRKKNLTYYTHASFQQASDTFAKMNSEGKLTPGEWKEFAEQQTVSLPKDKSVMPVDTEIPLPWPATLSDFEKMKPSRRFYNNLKRTMVLAEDGIMLQYSCFMTQDQRAAKTVRDLVLHYGGEVSVFRGEIVE